METAIKMEPKIEPIAPITSANVKETQPPPSANEIILPVECGPNKATLYLSRLCQGSRGPCVMFRGSWLTPNEFQYVSGRETAKDWKRSIRHGGKSLKLLVAKGVMSLNPPRCGCENCGGTSTTNEPNKENLQNGTTSPLDVKNPEVLGAPPPQMDLNSTPISSLPGSMSKSDHVPQLGFTSPVKQPHSSASSVDLGPVNHPSNPLAPPRDLNGNMPGCMNGYVGPSQPHPSAGTHNGISSCGGGDQRPHSMRDCTSSDPQVQAQKVAAPANWPTPDAIHTVDRPACSGDVEALQQQRAACGVVQPTATMPPIPHVPGVPGMPGSAGIPGVSAAPTVLPAPPSVPGLPGSESDRASEAYAYYLRSLQSLGQPTPSSEDLNNSSYGEFLRRYYQWYSEVNRKSMYPTPGNHPSSTPSVLPVTPTPNVPRPTTGGYDSLLHYDYMRGSVPYYLPSSLYPGSALPPSGARLPTSTSTPTYTPSFLPPTTSVIAPTSSHLQPFQSLPPPPTLGSVNPVIQSMPPVSSAPDCALSGRIPNPAVKRPYDVTYLDLDKAEKQRKFNESSLIASQLSPPTGSPYLSYPGLSLSTPSYLGWDRRVPPSPVDHTASLLEYERHRHMDPFAPSMPSVYSPHTSNPFGMRPFVDSCKVLS